MASQSVIAPLRARARKLRTDGLSYGDIGMHLGVSRWMALYYCTREFKKKTDDRLETIRALKVQGLSYTEIGKQFDLTHQRVQQILVKEIPKPKVDRCMGCGRQAKSLHRHHTDYRTNDVQFLCINCHAKAHHSPVDIEIQRKLIQQWVDRGLICLVPQEKHDLNLEWGSI